LDGKTNLMLYSVAEYFRKFMYCCATATNTGQTQTEAGYFI